MIKGGSAVAPPPFLYQSFATEENTFKPLRSRKNSRGNPLNQNLVNARAINVLIN